MSNLEIGILVVLVEVGIYLLSLAIGFIWLHYTAEPKPKQNKSNKKGKSNV